MNNEEKYTNISVKIVFYTFIIFTIISTVISYSLDNLGGDLLTLNIGFPQDYSKYFFLFYLLPTILFYILYLLSMGIKIPYKIIFTHDTETDYVFHIIIFFILIFLLATVVLTPIGTISREETNLRVLALIFAFLQPFYFTIVYIYYYKSSTSRLYKINIMLYIIACGFTGFTGYILFFLPFIIAFLKKRINNFWLIVFFLLSIPLLPFLRIYKYMYKYNLSLNDIYDKFDIHFYLEFMRTIIDRFNYIPNIFFISDNKEYIHELFRTTKYSPIFQGYIGSLYHKVIFGFPVGNIHAELQALITGMKNSNSTFPLVSYFSIGLPEGLLNLYYTIFIYLLLTSFISIFSYSNKFFNYLLFLIAYTYLLKGWYWEYMNFLQGIILFTILIITFKYINTLRRNKCSKIKHY